jgi:hypothetical protein
MANKSASVAVLTAVAAVTSNVLFLAANGDRVSATIFNDSASANLFIALGPVASLTLYTAKIAPGQLYELPNTFDWYGPISGLWDAAIGSARVTELQ